jgi:hypothetical protein
MLLEEGWSWGLRGPQLGLSVRWEVLRCYGMCVMVLVSWGSLKSHQGAVALERQQQQFRPGRRCPQANLPAVSRRWG